MCFSLHSNSLSAWRRARWREITSWRKHYSPAYSIEITWMFIATSATTGGEGWTFGRPSFFTELWFLMPYDNKLRGTDSLESSTFKEGFCQQQRKNSTYWMHFSFELRFPEEQKKAQDDFIFSLVMCCRLVLYLKYILQNKLRHFAVIIIFFCHFIIRNNHALWNDSNWILLQIVWLKLPSTIINSAFNAGILYIYHFNTLVVLETIKTNNIYCDYPFRWISFPRKVSIFHYV